MYGEDKEVRLVDFGLAKDSRSHLHSYAGTPYFMAPEVLDGDYTHKCDIWSLACVLYMLMAGKLPFTGKHRSDVFEKIKKGRYQPIKYLSAELQSLLKQMFTLNPKNRPTAAECQTHIWFEKMLQTEAEEEKNLSEDVLKGL